MIGICLFACLQWAETISMMMIRDEYPALSRTRGSTPHPSRLRKQCWRGSERKQQIEDGKAMKYCLMTWQGFSQPL